jgi:hypothetical protein
MGQALRAGILRFQLRMTKGVGAGGSITISVEREALGAACQVLATYGKMTLLSEQYALTTASNLVSRSLKIG